MCVVYNSHVKPKDVTSGKKALRRDLKAHPDSIGLQKLYSSVLYKKIELADYIRVVPKRQFPDVTKRRSQELQERQQIVRLHGCNLCIHIPLYHIFTSM